MKRTERHHLKENAVASTIARATEYYERHARTVQIVAAAAVVVVLAIAGFTAWRARVNSRSAEMLADAMTVAQAQIAPPPVPGAPPAPAPAGTFPSAQARDQAALARFVAIANEYPSSPAGIAARYRAAALLASLGRYGEAVQRYQEVVDRAGTSIYGEMARLGIADADAAAGKYDQAIAAYRKLSQDAATLPVDGVLMQLGRAYQAAGKTADARQTFKQIVEEFPASPYAGDAQQAMDQLKG